MDFIELFNNVLIILVGIGLYLKIGYDIFILIGISLFTGIAIKSRNSSTEPAITSASVPCLHDSTEVMFRYLMECKPCLYYEFYGPMFIGFAKTISDKFGDMTIDDHDNMTVVRMIDDFCRELREEKLHCIEYQLNNINCYTDIMHHCGGTI